MMMLKLGICLTLCVLLSTAEGCPEGCRCSVYGVKCQGVTSLPADSFSEEDITTITLRDSIISDIHPLAFNNVSISYLNILNVSISKIHPNAFQNVTVSHFKFKDFALESLLSEAFTNVEMSHANVYDCDIGTIDTDAFKNVTFSHFKLYTCNISIIKSNAFNNMSASFWQMYLLNVTTIETKAFSKNFAASHFKFYNSTISSIQDYAFNLDADSVSNSDVYNTVIKGMTCKALETVARKRNLTTPDSCGPVVESTVDAVATCPQGCSCAQTYIVCEGLTAFPDVRLPLVNTISINNSTFNVPSSAVDHLPKLSTVTMSHVNIMSAEWCPFRNLRSGGIISLQRVSIQDSQDGLFCNLHDTNVEIFRVSFDSMASRTFFNVSSTFFKISDSSIIDIESSAFQDVDAKIVNIFRVNISNIKADAFDNFEGSTFHVYNSSLGSLKSGSFNNMNVSKLTFSNLNISTIETDAFTGNLTSERFQIYFANISKIEDYAFNTSQIEYSAVYNCSIKTMGCQGLEGIETKFNLELPKSCTDVNAATMTTLSAKWTILLGLYILSTLV